MIKTIKQKFGIVSMFIVGLSLALVNSVSAATDADLTASLASSTALMTDNKGLILTFIVGLVGITLVIALGKAGVFKAKSMIVKAFKK